MDLGAVRVQHRRQEPAQAQLLAVGRAPAAGGEQRQQQYAEAEPLHGATIRERKTFVARADQCGVPPLARHIHSPHFSSIVREAMTMPDSEPKRIGLTVEMKPHAYDPTIQPELFEGVLARRVVAFFIDV